MVLADEQELLGRAKQGDGAAYGEIVRRHQAAVFNLAHRMLGRSQDAEDAAQEAFLRAFRALERFQSGRPFAPWIKRIAMNVCLNWLESSRIRPHLLASDIVNGEDEAADIDRWSHPGPSPEQMLLANERAGRMRQAILQLPPRYKAVIELRHFQEMRYDEIATALGRPLSSVKSDLFRARKMLAQGLKDEER